MRNTSGIDIRTQKRDGAVTFGDIAYGGVSYSTPLFFGAYQSNNFLTLSAVYAALDIISSSIALMPLSVRQRAEGKDAIIENHPIPKLFDEALPSKFVLMRTIIWDMLWYGNAYIHIKRDQSGKPIKLTYLEHGDVTVVYDKIRGEVTYEVTNHKDIPISVRKEDMIHLFKNTRDGVLGIGILAFAEPAFQLSDYLNTSAEDYFGSGCGINGILKFKGQVPDKAKKEIRQQWSQIHGAGMPGAGLAIASADCDFIPVSQDPAKSQMIESRRFAIEEIARFFGINPLLLGDMSAGSWSNIEEINIQFVQYTILPIVTLCETEFKRKLLPNVPNQWLDMDETVLLKSNKQAQANYLSTLTKSGIMTINEARATLDLNPTEDGDKLLIPYTDVNMNDIAQGQQEEIE